MLSGELHNSVYSLFPTVQWGNFSSAVSTWKQVTFPIAFPNQCFVGGPITNFSTDAGNVSDASTQIYSITAKSLSRTGMSIYTDGNWKNRGWFAIGK